MPVRLVFFRRSAVPKAMAASRPNERVSRNQISLARPTSIVIGVSANDSYLLERFVWFSAHSYGSSEVVTIATGDKGERWALIDRKTHESICHFVY